MSTIFTVYDEHHQERTVEFTCPQCGHDTIEGTWGGYRFLPLEEVILWDDHNSRVTWKEEEAWHRTKQRSFACAQCGNTFTEDGEACESPHELYQILFHVSGSDGPDGLAKNREPDAAVKHPADSKCKK